MGDVDTSMSTLVSRTFVTRRNYCRIPAFTCSSGAWASTFRETFPGRYGSHVTHKRKSEYQLDAGQLNYCAVR